MSFRLVPESETLNVLERRNGRYIALSISGPALYYIFSTVNMRQAYVLRQRASTSGGIYARIYCIL